MRKYEISIPRIEKIRKIDGDWTLHTLSGFIIVFLLPPYMTSIVNRGDSIGHGTHTKGDCCGCATSFKW